MSYNNFRIMEDFWKEMSYMLLNLGISKSVALALSFAIYTTLTLTIAWLVGFVCRKWFSPTIIKFVNNTSIKWDDYLFTEAIMHSFCKIITPLVFLLLIPIAFKHFQFEYSSIILDWTERILLVYIIIRCILMSLEFISNANKLSDEHDKWQKHSIAALFQFVKLIVFLLGIIFITAALMKKSPTTFIAGLGAAATVIMFIFKDTIIGLISGIQLSINGMIQIGDWISIPKHGIDGTVERVSLVTVKIRNWDNTISTIPPNILLNDGFQNWRGMQESGGRRVKRSFNIDANTIHLCTEEEVDILKKKSLVNKQEKDLLPTTNLTLFRHYIEHILRENNKVNHSEHLMVRQMQSAEKGIVVEFYFFLKEKRFVHFENLQAEILELIIATLPEFGLKMYQLPSAKI